MSHVKEKYETLLKIKKDLDEEITKLQKEIRPCLILRDLVEEKIYEIEVILVEQKES